MGFPSSPVFSSSLVTGRPLPARTGRPVSRASLPLARAHPLALLQTCISSSSTASPGTRHRVPFLSSPGNPPTLWLLPHSSPGCTPSSAQQPGSGPQDLPADPPTQGGSLYPRGLSEPLSPAQQVPRGPPLAPSSASPPPRRSCFLPESQIQAACLRLNTSALTLSSAWDFFFPPNLCTTDCCLISSPELQPHGLKVICTGPRSS